MISAERRLCPVCKNPDGFCVAGHDCHAVLDQELEAARARIASLEQRLEVFGTDGTGGKVQLPEGCDGIACRNETIKQLTAQVDQLRAQGLSQEDREALLAGAESLERFGHRVSIAHAAILRRLGAQTT